VTFTTRDGGRGRENMDERKNLLGGWRITRVKEHEMVSKEIVPRKRGTTRDGKMKQKKWGRHVHK